MGRRAKIFYPRGEGMTKKEVIEMIKQRQQEYTEFNDLWAPMRSLLTDKLMQQFVDDWVETFMEGAVEETVEAACDNQEDVLLELAKKICVDPKAKR